MDVANLPTLMSFDTFSFDQLRGAIFTSKEEYERFRSVVVNAVAATDFFNCDLQTSRTERWNLLFPSCSSNKDKNEAASIEEATRTDSTKGQKAALVLDYLIQASDIAHCMQHWHVYTKWNEKLFVEMLKAYHNGRLENDPCSFWYEEEVAFFDNYVIPLAAKLKGCGVSEVYSDECLNYAKQNRSEWVARGKEVVQKMTETFNQLKSASQSDPSATEQVAAARERSSDE